MRSHRLSKEEIKEMLSLYQTGEISSVKLGKAYGIDHATLLYHAKKHGVMPRRNLTIRELRLPPKKKWIPKPRIPVVDKYADIFDYQERPSTRSYSSYFAEAMKRPAERHYMESYRLI